MTDDYYLKCSDFGKSSHLVSEKGLDFTELNSGIHFKLLFTKTQIAVYHHHHQSHHCISWLRFSYKIHQTGQFQQKMFIFSQKRDQKSMVKALLCDLQTAVFSLCSHVAFPLCSHARASSAVPSCSSKDTRSITLGPYCYDLNSTSYSCPHCSRFPNLGTRVNKHFR